MSTKRFAFSLAALAAAVAVGIYVALQYFALGSVLLALGIAAGIGLVALIASSAGRVRRGARRGASSAGGGWMWFDGGGHDGGGWGGGDGGGGGGGCGSS